MEIDVTDEYPVIFDALNPTDYAPITEGLDDPHVLKAVFTAGAGGSGKGRVISAMFDGTGLKIIDQDKHLERFLQAAKVPLAKAGTRYDLLKKAQRMKAAEIRMYGSRRLGLVIDSTGWEYERIAGPMKKLRSLGYDCYMVFVSAPLEVALKRNQERAKSGGRLVPDSFIKTAHDGAHQNLPGYKQLFGPSNVVIVRNATDTTDQDWTIKVTPKLRKLARSFLARPLKNPIGVKWLEGQTAGAPEPTVTDYDALDRVSGTLAVSAKKLLA